MNPPHKNNKSNLKENIINNSNSQQKELCFKICPSHLSVSHRFACQIKPHTYYHLNLLKNNNKSSQINEYQNQPISAKVFLGKILLSNINIPFTVKLTSQNKSKFDYLLRIQEVMNIYTGQNTPIGQYNLQINHYLQNYFQNGVKYFYEQCDLHDEIYLTFQLFIEKNRAALQLFIIQEKHKQKRRIREKVQQSCQEKKKSLSLKTLTSIQQTNIMLVLNTQINLIKKLEQEQEQQRLSKIFAKKEKKQKHKNSFLQIQTPKLGDTMLRLENPKEYELRQSQISFQEQIQPPVFRQSLGRKQRKGSVLIDSAEIKHDSSLKKSADSLLNQSIVTFQDQNDSKVQILIRAPPPEDRLVYGFQDLKGSQLQRDQNQYEEVVNEKKQNTQNQYQRSLKFIKLTNQRQQQYKQSLWDQLDVSRSQQQSQSQWGVSNSRDVDMLHASEIRIEQATGQIKILKKASFMFIILIIFLIFRLVDHPYFDFGHYFSKKAPKQTQKSRFKSSKKPSKRVSRSKKSSH